jgi:hypothetical protein
MLIITVDVDDVYMTTLSTSTNNFVRVPSGSDIVLRESAGVATSSSSGVGCVAVISRGGYNTAPPNVAVFVVVSAAENGSAEDVVNATSWFQSSVETQRTVTDSGLSFYRVKTRLLFVTARPDAELNGRTIRCVARSQGFGRHRHSNPVVATARLIVQCKPRVLFIFSLLIRLEQTSVSPRAKLASSTQHTCESS